METGQHPTRTFPCSASSSLNRAPGISWLRVTVLFLLCASTAYPQDHVTGTVFDAQGDALAGATVLLVGTDRQTITDLHGQFLLAARTGDQLQVSFVGFESVDLVIKEENDLQIYLTESVTMLQEAVVIGYGSAPRSDVTGAVSSVSSKDFVKGNITASLQQVQGKIPGLVITQPGGDPNSDFNVRIRGATSLEGQPPLLVIDGVAVDDFNRAITTVNPNDIASYDVLKDASAAAIYGSRGANGVILITTKKAERGKVSFQYNGFGSIEEISHKYDVLTRDEWLSATAEDTTAYHYDMGGDTDWQKAITRTAYSQSHTISASGGTEQLRVWGSVGYLKQEGIVRRTEKEVVTARVNANFSSVNEKFDVELGINTSVIDRDMLPDQTSTAQNRLGGAAVFPWTNSYLPVWPVYLDDGSYFQPPNSIPNPVLLVNELHSHQQQNFFQSILRGDYELIKGLKAGATAALSQGNDAYSQFWPPLIGTNDDAFGGRSSASKRNFTGDMHLNYNRAFGDHTLQVMGVYEYNKFINDGFGVEGTGQVAHGLQLPDNLGSASFRNMSSFKNEVRIISWLGRLTYDFRDRYLLTVNFRRDGSSRFGPNHRWGNFPSAAVAWHMTNENFMKRASWLDLKLRMSYGLTGNQENLTPNNYQTLYGPSGKYYYDGGNGQAYAVTQEANPDLKWEVRKSLNVGIDFGLWGNRLRGIIDVYSDRTSDMLFLYNIPQPPFVTNQAYANAANATNKGIELMLEGALIHRADFSWSLRANVGMVRNRVTSLVGEFKGFELSVTDTRYGDAYGGSFQIAPVTQIAVGHPVGVFWLPEHYGYDESGREVFVQYDAAGNVVGTDISFSDEDKRYVDPTPDYEWGLTNTFHWKRFDLSFFARGIQGAKAFANGKLALESRAYLPRTNITTDALKSRLEQKPNISTYWLQDASYARLENATLGYTFGGIRGVSQLRIYATARNLLLLTRYGGIDPEVNVEGRQRYIDYSYYPKTRSFAFGIDLTF